MQQPAQRKKFQAEALKQAEKQALDRSLREQNIKFNRFYLQRLTRQDNPVLKTEYERQERATATEHLHGYLDILEEMKQTNPQLEGVNWQPIHNEILHDANLFEQCLSTTQDAAKQALLSRLLALDNPTASNLTLQQIIDNDQERVALSIISDSKQLDYLTAASPILCLTRSLLDKNSAAQRSGQRRRTNDTSFYSRKNHRKALNE